MIFAGCDIKIPKNINMEKWSVIACDQYTSEPEYWERVEAFVGDEPSTCHLIVPEYLLERDDIEPRIAQTHKVMRDYLHSNMFETLRHSMLYVERVQADGFVRRGIIMAVDLEQYDYSAGSKSPIRATEGTVLSRIPPRLKVRRDAVLEVPHIMLLIDDEQHEVIDPITVQTADMQMVYNFHLMEGGGVVKGFLLDKRTMETVSARLERLIEPEYYHKKYGDEEKHPLLFAVGDGNHSLAAAKACYEELKQRVGEDEAAKSPARYAMVEVVNLHDRALQFEAIHRVVFGCDAERLLDELDRCCGLEAAAGGQKIEIVMGQARRTEYMKNKTSNLSVGTLQNFLDKYLKEHEGRLDYIHGEESVISLCQQPDTIGFLLPDFHKSELFPTVMRDGALPRKTFSMGHAWDKRYYLECRQIKEDKAAY